MGKREAKIISILASIITGFIVMMGILILPGKGAWGNTSQLVCTENDQCTAGEYCRKVAGDCQGDGACIRRADVCAEYYDPVCGCDGRTYGNSCEAAEGGASVDHPGECAGSIPVPPVPVTVTVAPPVTVPEPVLPPPPVPGPVLPPPPVPLPVVPPVHGDLNGDGQITAQDALIAFQCYLTPGSCLADADEADIDQDGVVTPADALCLFRKFLGKPSCMDMVNPPDVNSPDTNPHYTNLHDTDIDFMHQSHQKIAGDLAGLLGVLPTTFHQKVSIDRQSVGLGWEGGMKWIREGYEYTTVNGALLTIWVDPNSQPYAVTYILKRRGTSSGWSYDQGEVLAKVKSILSPLGITFTQSTDLSLNKSSAGRDNRWYDLAIKQKFGDTTLLYPGVFGEIEGDTGEINFLKIYRWYPDLNEIKVILSDEDLKERARNYYASSQEVTSVPADLTVGGFYLVKDRLCKRVGGAIVDEWGTTQYLYLDVQNAEIVDTEQLLVDSLADGQDASGGQDGSGGLDISGVGDGLDASDGLDGAGGVSVSVGANVSAVQAGPIGPSGPAGIQGGPPQGLMLLIEYEGMEGLTNFVYELQKRVIPSFLLASADFVAQHAEDIKNLQRYGMQVGALCSPSPPLWDVPYEEQYQIIKDRKEMIEACLGTPIKAIASTYFAYDENTLKVAEVLGIPYVMARGTTGAKATIYQPEGYKTRIFSVSNVSSEKWGTGSLCDYSYWAREGTPAQFSEELFDAALQQDKISPVSHTRIGGLKAAWNAVYLDFFDHASVHWVSLDAFGSAVDARLPLSEIPQNREVEYTTPKPSQPLEEEPNVDNPCQISDFPPLPGQGNSNGSNESNGSNAGDIGDTGNAGNTGNAGSTGSTGTGNTGNAGNASKVEGKIVIFHNGYGSMCLAALDFLDTLDYPVEQHLNTDADFREKLNELKALFGPSEGLSETFGYFPMIFVKDNAYSGFNDQVKEGILQAIALSGEL